MDLFSTNVMTGVVNSLQTPPSFLLDTFFPAIQTEQSEEIHFDVETDVMGLAPFVSPVVEGKVMSDVGFTTKTFKPAYVKPKNVWDNSRPLKRYKGEQIGGSLAPADRQRLILADNLMNHVKLIRRRKEWMASAILRTGAVTISGELYQTVSVSFGRDAALTITLTGGNRWGQAGIKPLDLLQDWADLINEKSGAEAVDVVMDVAAWKVFRSDTDVKDRLNVQRRLAERPSMAQDAVFRIGGNFAGAIDGFNIWVYSGRYKDDAGALQKLLPSGTVIMVGEMLGVQAYGAILDEAAGFQALPYFSKSWIENDPPRRFVMTQSAPLLVPYRPNASLCATVL